METTASARATGFQFRLLPGWPVAAGLAALAVPTLFTVGEQFWSKEIGAHGPIILATGLWLLGRQRPELRRFAEAPRGWVTALLFIPSLASYIFGRSSASWLSRPVVSTGPAWRRCTTPTVCGRS